MEAQPHDADGNAIHGNGVALDAKNVHIRSDDLLTAVVGVDDVIVVSTQDAVLVLTRGQGDKVKELVDALKATSAARRPSTSASTARGAITSRSTTGARYQVKRIVVSPGRRLSLQKHFHRAEHWVVVQGTAQVTRGAEDLMVHENESVFLPIGVVHRLANPGKIDLELIEVQTGSYLGEDDIIRLEDVYHRRRRIASAKLRVAPALPLAGRGGEGPAMRRAIARYAAPWRRRGRRRSRPWPPSPSARRSARSAGRVWPPAPRRGRRTPWRRCRRSATARRR